MRLARPAHALVPFLASLLACGGDEGFSARLPNGARVSVGADGALEVRHGGRTLFALAPGRGVEIQTFDTDITEIWGFYVFDETNRAIVPIAEFVSAEREGDDVVVRFEREDGDAGIATLRFHGEASDDATHVTVTVTDVDGVDAITLPTRCDPESSYLGFGAQYNATNQRGEAFPLWVQEQGVGRHGLFPAAGDAHTSYFPMPYFLDARGFGTVIDTDARVVVDLCQSEPQVASFRVDHADPVELVLLHGPTPRDVVRQLGDRYGRPTTPESWVFEPWIGVQGGQQVVLDEADALDAAQIPWSSLWVQDWVGFLDLGGPYRDIQYHWNVDTALYPDLPALTAALHADGKRFLGYINPFVEQQREHFATMDAMGWLVRDGTGASYVFESLKGPTSLPDLTDPGARTYVAGYMTAMLETYGMDGWMADFAEWLPTDAVLDNGVSAMREHNLYPRRWQELNHATARASVGNDYAIFTRSGWLGSQGTTQVVWIGDQEADFLAEDGLPTVVPAMVNLGLSGVPYVTHDIAGYSGGPSTMELWLRWTELGAFTPIMRTHEGLKAGLNWNWNGGPDATQEERDATIAHFRRFARIHVALQSTFEALAAEAAVSSLPIVRHLVLEYPDDPEVVSISDEFLLGRDLLVAPVVTAATTEREVYFPEGDWYHVLRASEVYHGPGRYLVPAPIGEPPVFSRGAERSDLRVIP